MAEGGHLASCRSNEKRSAFSLNNLNDELLIEILCRLPTPKSVLVRCILVCKRWHSLIFSSYFVSQFVEHRRNQSKNSYYPAYQNPPSVFVALTVYDQWYHNRNIYNFLLAAGAEDAISESARCTWDFLPEKRESVSVVASCNDLLLCLAVTESYGAYYVCNPLTKHWLRLHPSATSIDHPWLSMEKFGLVYHESNNGILDQEKYECRFRVLVFPSKDDSMHVYCSETKHWDEFPLLGEEYRPYSCNIVAFDGKLYWCNARVEGAVVAYDPFSHETIIIRYGLDDKISKNKAKRGSTVINCCLGICQGTLRFMRLEKGDVGIAGHISIYLSVWELNDHKSARLTMKHSIFFKWGNPMVRKLFYAKPLGFHPTEEDVVYIENDIAHTVFSYKIQEEDLEMVIHKDHRGNSRPLLFNLRGGHLPITTMLPWWPTPVSDATY